MQRLRGVALDALSVVILGLRLIWRHWPWLLAIYLLGSAAHGGLIWFAVNVSKTQPFVAGLILPLAPIASMAALILMLRRLAPSLSHAAFVTQGTAVAGSGAGSPPASGEEPAYSAGGVLAVDPTSEMAPATATPSEGRFLSRAAAQLSLVVSMLVPFLTLYSTQGYLDEDRNVFVNAAGTDELLGNADIFYGGSANVVGRIFLVTGLASVVLLVVVTFLIRRIANRFQLASRHLILALAIGYVEVFWLFSVANILDAFKTGLWSWIQGRVVVVWFIEHFNLLIAALGELGRPLRAVADLLTSIVNSSTNVILIPLAWLVVGAIAYGAGSRCRPGRRSGPPADWPSGWSGCGLARSSFPSLSGRSGGSSWAICGSGSATWLTDYACWPSPGSSRCCSSVWSSSWPATVSTSPPSSSASSSVPRTCTPGWRRPPTSTWGAAPSTPSC